MMGAQSSPKAEVWEDLLGVQSWTSFLRWAHLGKPFSGSTSFVMVPFKTVTNLGGPSQQRPLLERPILEEPLLGHGPKDRLLLDAWGRG